MNTILVWVLITMGGYNSNTATYSPPLADLESCQRMQKAFNDMKIYSGTSQCIQVKVIK